jgi:hypothetical protein
MPEREGDKVEMENRQETLLRTYEVCNQDSNAMVRNYWAATAAFLSVNTGVLAWLAKTAISSGRGGIFHPAIFGNVVITAVGLAITSITVFLWLWLKSTNRRIHINNRAMVLIERELNIRGKERIAYILARRPRFSGSQAVKGIYLTMISVWGLIVGFNVAYAKLVIIHDIIRHLLQFAK